jgi:hypothetical protein
LTKSLSSRTYPKYWIMLSTIIIKLERFMVP